MAVRPNKRSQQQALSKLANWLIWTTDISVSRLRPLAARYVVSGFNDCYVSDAEGACAVLERAAAQMAAED
jgi:hypothetical protein